MNKKSHFSFLNIIGKTAVFVLIFLYIFNVTVVFANGDSHSERVHDESSYESEPNHDNHDEHSNPCGGEENGHTNTAPVITLLGSNPVTITVGAIYTDLGATAQDTEDGDITANITATSTVNTMIVGIYSITYNVTDSGNLSATPVVRTVNVILSIPSINNPPVITLVGSTPMIFNIGASFIDPGATAIDIEDGNITANITSTSTVNTLAVGTYSIEYGVTDSGGLRATTTRAVIVNPIPECAFPQINSFLATSTTVGQTFSYTLTATTSFATTTSIVFNVATTSLPSGLSFSTTTNVITGTSTQVGVFNINITVTNSCGQDSRTFVLTVNDVVPDGDGGNGGGNPSPSSNIAVTKTVDKPTASVGDTVTYSISVVNNGPDNATGVSIKDILPNSLDFVSASSSIGTYSTTTSTWTVGDLANGSSTALILVSTIHAGFEGQKITNTATASSTQSDTDSSNNITNADVNVNPVISTACTSNCGGGSSGGNGGGGGGGGNGPIVGSYGIVNSSNGSGSQIGASTVKGCYYLFDYLRADFKNNPIEVTKLQVFLRDLEGFKDIKITGVYDEQTIVAVDAFQARYASDILTPWGHDKPTGYTYILTKKKVNEIYCKTAFPITPLQQTEIDNYRDFLLGLKDAGIVLPKTNSQEIDKTNSTGPVPVELTPEIPNSVVGKKSTTNTEQGTLSSISTTTKNIISNFTANVIGAGKNIAGFYSNTGLTGWINLLLIATTLVVTYLWYRERRRNKKLEIINKEIDLS
ncbi:MAG: immunoglobulin-like domain-containing protein [Minisyncoccia bacterium]